MSDSDCTADSLLNPPCNATAVQDYFLTLSPLLSDATLLLLYHYSCCQISALELLRDVVTNCPEQSVIFMKN